MNGMTAAIHETAILGAGAKLGSNVRIGPYAIVEDEVELGSDCFVEAHAIVKNGTVLGDGCRVGHFAVLGGEPQYLAFDPATSSGVKVGKGTRIGEGVTIHRSIREKEVTCVGDNVFLMGYSHVAHDCLVGDQVVVANGALLGGHVELGKYCFVGGGAAFHQFVRVGDGAMVGGMAEVSADVPPFVTVARRNLACGLNLVGLRRREFSQEVIGDLKECYRAVYFHEGNPQGRAEETLASGELPSTSEGREFLEFFLSGERGFVRNRKKQVPEDDS
ncbi:MAG: acyl-ACP--UDP-N-acetylglucosamine O-acyltransferase [Opitutae bacterium]|nr:acyl-ACP--UDP-N-acetylglucosamine O-acyltransferase [Opitutae bacterium]